MNLIQLGQWLVGLAVAEILVVLMTAVSLQMATRVVAKSSVARTEAAQTVLLWHLVAALLALVLYSPQLFGMITGNQARAVAAPPASASLWLVALIVLSAGLIIGLRHHVGFLNGMVILVVTLVYASPIVLILAAALHLLRGAVG